MPPLSLRDNVIVLNPFINVNLNFGMPFVLEKIVNIPNLQTLQPHNETDLMMFQTNKALPIFDHVSKPSLLILLKSSEQSLYWWIMQKHKKTMIYTQDLSLSFELDTNSCSSNRASLESFGKVG